MSGERRHPLCEDCGQEVDPRRDYREVRGWERPRTSGGLHALKGRVETGRWLHRWCEEARALGGQGSLLG